MRKQNTAPEAEAIKAYGEVSQQLAEALRLLNEAKAKLRAEALVDDVVIITEANPQHLANIRSFALYAAESDIKRAIVETESAISNFSVLDPY